MARVDDDAPETGVLYDLLLADEERRYARRGGRRLLVGTPSGVEMRVVAAPGPLLSRLRAGQPVEVEDWKLPAWAREGPVRGELVTVSRTAQIVPGRV